jgi:CheY-like chemotaxis protein
VKHSILLVDDDPLTLNLLEMIFESADFHVLIADNGVDALRQVESHQPDVILLDIMMPMMDGIEVCHKVRNLDGMANLPILFLTTCTQLKAMEACKLAGATGYLIKPTPRQEMVKTVRSALITTLTLA